jgi:sulfur transfer protein SufE
MLGKGINGARNNLRSIPQSFTLYQQLVWYNSKLTELDDVMKIHMQNSLSCQSCRLFFASIDSYNYMKILRTGQVLLSRRVKTQTQ